MMLHSDTLAKSPPSCSSLLAGLLAGWALLSGPAEGAAASQNAISDAATDAPRTTVERVAELIEDKYFDAAKGAAIAASLRAAAQSGEFDPLRQPRELASGLTSLLHPLDHHFRIIVSGDRDGRAAGGASADFADPSSAERRTAYGFRRVEMMPGAIGYIDLQSFAYLSTAKRDDPGRAAANAALQLVAGADAIIIDLRDNVGGSTDMAAYLVSAFTAPGANIYDVIHWRNGIDSERPTLPYPRPRLDVPLYLLISARTASAAEAAAYALQASGRALLVGEKSAGAANVGGVFPVDENLGVFIPIGTPINPLTGSNWENKGIVPDFVVPAEAALPYAQQLALTTALARDGDGPQAAYTRAVLEAVRAQAAHPAGPPLNSYAGVYSGTVVTAGDNLLTLRQGNRMPSTLLRLTGDTFFDQDDPARRIVFERATGGTITGLRLIYANGHELWFPARAVALPPLPLPGTAGAP